MGRNDLCFCGSGLKQKKCHPEINENSEAAKKLDLYSRLDNCVQEYFKENDTQPFCYYGCSACCYHFFTIQSIEFDLILYELRNWPKEEIELILHKVKEYWEIFVRDYPEMDKMLNESYFKNYTKINFSLPTTSFPCVFLDDEKKICKIYRMRPFACRIYGTTLDKDDESIRLHICGETLNKRRKNQILKRMVDCTSYSKEHIENTYAKHSSLDTAITFRELPLFYYMYNHFFVQNMGCNIANYELKFKYSKQQYNDFWIENEIRKRKRKHKFSLCINKTTF